MEKKTLFAIVLWFVTLFSGILFFDPIKEYYSSEILKINPDVIVTLNTYIYLENPKPVSITEFTKTLENKYNEVANLSIGEILKKTQNLTINDIKIGIPLSSKVYSYVQVNTSEKFCNIVAPSRVPSKAGRHELTTFVEKDVPECTNCIKTRVAIFNNGNKTATNLRTTICTDKNFYVTQGTAKIYDKCMMVEKDAVLPGDLIDENIVATNFNKFETPTEFFNIVSASLHEWRVSGKYEDNVIKEIQNKDVWHFIVFIIPNCTTISSK